MSKKTKELKKKQKHLEHMIKKPNWEDAFPGLNSFSARHIALVAFGAMLFLAPYFRGLFFYDELVYFHLASALLFGIASWNIIKVKGNNLLESALDWVVFAFALSYILSIFIQPANMRDAVGEAMKVVNYFFVYWLAAYLINTRKELYIILTLSVLTGVGVSLAGIGTALGTFTFHGAWDGSRIYSTLQYHNTLAAYLMSLSILALYLWSRNKHYGFKLFFGIANFLYVITIIGTASRGAWLLYPPVLFLLILGLPGRHRWETIINIFASSILGAAIATKLLPAAINGPTGQGWWWLGAGVLLMAAYQAVFSWTGNNLGNIKFTKKAGVVTAGGVLLLLVVSTGYLISKSTADSVFRYLLPAEMLARIQTISLQTHSAAERIFFYQDALKIIKDYPVFGLGGGGWKAMYQAYQGHLYFTTEVHNHFLQVWVEVGTVGLALFLAVWIFSILFAWHIYRSAPEEETRALTWALMVGALGLGLHSFLDFNLSLGAVSVLLWFLIGAIKGLEPESGTVKGQFNKLNQPAAKAIAVSLSCLLFLMSASLAISQQQVNKTVLAVKTRDVANAEKYLINAMKYDPFDASIPLDLAQIYNALGNAENDGQMLSLAVTYAEKAVAKEPSNHQYRITYAGYLFNFGEIEGAVAEIERAVELAPLQQQGYHNLADAYLAAAKYMIKDGKEDTGQYLVKLEQLPARINSIMENIPAERLITWIHGPKLEITPRLKFTLALAKLLGGQLPQGKELLLETVETEEFKDRSLALLEMIAAVEQDSGNVEKLVDLIIQ